MVFNYDITYTDNLARPFALLLLKIFLPPWVLILSLNPWVLFLLLLCGLYVIDIKPPSKVSIIIYQLEMSTEFSYYVGSRP